MKSCPTSRRLIFAAILVIFVYGMNSAMLGALLPALSDRFSLSPRQNSFLALVQALGLSVASIAAGPLVDNQGKKTGLLLGLSIVTVSMIALPNAGAYGTILACWLALGFGGGVIV